MTEESERDHFESGIATTLSTSSDTTTVNGVALPVNTVVNGGRNVDHYYPKEVLEEAAEELEGKQIVKNFHDLEGQAPADDVIGKVTATTVDDSLGLLFEGEISDDEIAEKIANGFLEVSPTVARSLGEKDDTMSAQRVERIAGFRDIAVVANGQPGASVETGSNPAITALSMDALAGGVLCGDESAESDTGPAVDDPESDDPEGASSAASNEETNMSENELSDDEKAVLAASEDVENPIEVLSSHAAAEQPTIVEQTEIDALESDVEELSGVFRDALKEQKDLTSEMVEDMGVDALTSAFRNEEGEIEAETLSQSPETQDTTSEEETETDALSDLSDEDREELKDRKEKYDYWNGKNDTMADAEADAITALADEESVEDIDWEAL